MAEKQLSFLDASSVNLIHKNNWNLYVDGASRNNPGLAGAGICIYKNNTFFLKRGFFLGQKTNNQAEYLSLLLGIFLIKEQQDFNKKNDFISIKADSLLLVRQVAGHYKVKSAGLMALHRAVLLLLDGLNFSIEHIMRHLNTIADEAANEGVDQRLMIFSSFVAFCRANEISL